MADCTLMCTEQPTLQKAGHPMASWEKIFSNRSGCPQHTVFISLALQTAVAAPTICLHLTTNIHHTEERPLQRLPRCINYFRQANSSNLSVFQLYGQQNQDFASRSTPTFSSLLSSYIAFINLYNPSRRSRPGRTIARRNLCNHVHAVW